jgi:hypothetical protein
MQLTLKKQITTLKPVKAWKVIVWNGSTWFTGPWQPESIRQNEWVSATNRNDYGHPPFRTLTPPAQVGYHAYKSYAMGLKGLHYQAATGRLSRNGDLHYVIPVYLRGEVAFGNYYGRFKGVSGSEILIKSKHMPVITSEVVHIYKGVLR